MTWEPLLPFANEIDGDCIRALRIMCYGVEGDQDISFVAQVLNRVGNARRKGKAIYFFGRNLNVYEVIILAATDQCGADHGDDLLAFEMVVIPPHDTRQTDDHVTISKARKSIDVQGLENKASGV